MSSAGIRPVLSTAVTLRCVREWKEAPAVPAPFAEAAPSVVALAAALPEVVPSVAVLAEVVPSVVVPAAALTAVVRSAEAPALAVVVPSAVVHTAALAVAVPSVVVRMVVDTAVDMVEVAEWVDTGNSEHQFPDFRIRHPRNLAH